MFGAVSERTETSGSAVSSWSRLDSLAAWLLAWLVGLVGPDVGRPIKLLECQYGVTATKWLMPWE